MKNISQQSCRNKIKTFARKFIKANCHFFYNHYAHTCIKTYTHIYYAIYGYTHEYIHMYVYKKFLNTRQQAQHPL